MKISKEELLDALATSLDPARDEDWTEEGLPVLERVQDITLDDTVTRDDLNVHANGFTREVAADALKPKDEDLAMATTSPTPPSAEELGLQDEDEASRRSHLAANLEDAKQALADAQAILLDAKKLIAEKTAELDKAIKAHDDEFPPLLPAHAIQHWLASEARKRAERSSQVYQVTQPKSPLDASMARPTGHGRGRKQVPLVAAAVA